MGIVVPITYFVQWQFINKGTFEKLQEIAFVGFTTWRHALNPFNITTFGAIIHFVENAPVQLQLIRNKFTAP